MTSIRSVAKAAGVSVTTVSNVLNGRDSRMRAETRARVLKAMEELHYMPNANAQQLKSGQNRTIGLMVPSVANPFWGAVAHHVERAAHALDYKVLIGNTTRDPEAERRYGEMLLASGVRGIILASAHVPFNHFEPLVQRGMLLASFGGRPDGRVGQLNSSVSVDLELVGRLSAMHLLGLGHRRIAMLWGPLHSVAHNSRLNGIRTALRDAGIEMDEAMIWSRPGEGATDENEGLQMGRVGIRELLSRDAPPTAIIAVNDIYAMGAYAGAADLGFSVPRDLSIIGFDDMLFSEFLQPALTTIRQPVARMAETLVATLIEQIREGEADAERPAHVSIPPELIVRASTAPPPPGRAPA